MAQDTEQIDNDKPKKKSEKKGKRGSVVVLAVVLPLLLAGGFLGAAYAGLVKVPGLKLPGMKQKSAVANYMEREEEKDVAALDDGNKTPEVEVKVEPVEEVPEVIAEVKPETDPQLGAKKLAAIWNSMNPTDVVKISASYQDIDFARVLSNMESDKVAKILAEIKDPNRAAKISQEIESLASIVPPQEI